MVRINDISISSINRGLRSIWQQICCLDQRVDILEEEGIAGPQGIQGIQGEQGVEGPQGIQGEVGAALTVLGSYPDLASF